MRPEISVITATRNAAQHLPALADVLLRQPGELLEWIVIDALSSDGTVEFLRSLTDVKLSWISEADSGIYDAWNKGVDRSRGRWLMFLGADDLVDDRWLRACAEAPDVDLVYGNLQIRGTNGELLTTIRPRPWEHVKPYMKVRMMLPHPGLAHRRSLFESRRFDTSFKIAGDFHFLAGVGVNSAACLPLTQASMQLGGVSNRPDRVDMAFRENARVLREQGRKMPIPDRLRWMLKRSSAAFTPGLFLALQRLGWRLRRSL